MEHSCQVYLIFFQDRSWTNLVEDEQGHPSPGVDHTAVIYECVSKICCAYSQASSRGYCYVFGGFDSSSKLMHNSLWRWSFGEGVKG